MAPTTSKNGINKSIWGKSIALNRVRFFPYINGSATRPWKPGISFHKKLLWRINLKSDTYSWMGCGQLWPDAGNKRVWGKVLNISRRKCNKLIQIFKRVFEMFLNSRQNAMTTTWLTKRGIIMKDVSFFFGETNWS